MGTPPFHSDSFSTTGTTFPRVPLEMATEWESHSTSPIAFLSQGLGKAGSGGQLTPKIRINQYDFKGWGESQRTMLHDKTWFLTLTPSWKMVSAHLSFPFFLCSLLITLDPHPMRKIMARGFGDHLMTLRVSIVIRRLIIAKARHTKHRWPPRVRLPLSATPRFSSTLLCGRCLGDL